MQVSGTVVQALKFEGGVRKSLRMVVGIAGVTSILLLGTTVIEHGLIERIQGDSFCVSSSVTEDCSSKKEYAKTLGARSSASLIGMLLSLIGLVGLGKENSENESNT